MYCQKCREFLTGKENFCSNCGERVKNIDIVEKKETDEPIGFVDKQKDAAKEETKTKLPEMNWNAFEFHQPKKKTQETIISWRNDDMFLSREMRESSESFLDKKSEEEEVEAKSRLDRDTKSDLEVPNVFRISREKAEEPQFFKDDEGAGESTVVEIAQPRANLEVEVSSDGNVEKTLNHQVELTTAILNEDELLNLEAIISEAKEKEEAEERMQLQEKNLFDEISQDVAHALENSKIDEERKRIDRFYTFNKKKEEFQRLLDKEYERIENNIESGGFEKDVENFIDVEVGTDVEGTTQLEEMMKTRELFFDAPLTMDEIKKANEDIFTAADKDIQKEVNNEPENQEYEISEAQRDDGHIDDMLPTEDDFEKESVQVDEIFLSEGDIADDKAETAGGHEDMEPAFMRDESFEHAEMFKSQDDNIDEGVLEDVKPSKNKSTSTDTAQIIMEPAKDDETKKIADEFFSDDEEKKKGKKNGVLLTVLIVLTILVGGLFIVRVTMPTSYLAKHIDNIADKIVSLFKSEETAKSTDTNKILDKTGIIANNKDKNQDNSIQEVLFNEELKYKSRDEKAYADIAKALSTQTLIWYKNENGDDVTYDSAAIGKLIEFVSKLNLRSDDNSSWQETVAEKSNAYSITEGEISTGTVENISKLEIGEIRKLNDKLYVWVKETSSSKSVKKIYEMQISEHTLMITDIKSL